MVRGVLLLGAPDSTLSVIGLSGTKPPTNHRQQADKQNKQKNGVTVQGLELFCNLFLQQQAIKAQFGLCHSALKLPQLLDD